MKKSIVIFAIISLLAVSAASFAACTPTDGGVIRLCEVTHSIFYAPLYTAVNLGYFEEEGVTVELTNGGGADKVMTAVLSGQADVGFCGPEAVVYVYNEGRTDYPKVIGQLTRMDGSFIIGRTPETFDWATSFRGKEIIGGRKGGVPAMALEYCLKKNGYTIGTDVILNYDVQFDLITAAFEGGVGDYCTMFEPAAATFQQQGKGYTLASVGAECGEIPYTAFCATQTYLDAHADEVRGFLRALTRAVDYVASHTVEEVADAVAPSFGGVDIALIRKSIENYRTIGAYVTDMHLDPQAFERLQDVIVEAGVMTRRAVYADVVTSDYLP